MKQEDYVSFEVAKLLKEKGYDEFCNAYYHNDNDKAYKKLTDDERFESCWQIESFSNKDNKYRDAAPSLAQAAKWLREEHNIHVDVGVAGDFSNDADGNVCEEWTFWVFDIYTIDSLHHFDVEDNREYSSYEEALNEGIKEALKMI